jgi:hypothetical protein
MKIDIDNTIPNTLKQANIWEGLIVNNKDDNKKVTKEIVFIIYVFKFDLTKVRHRFELCKFLLNYFSVVMNIFLLIKTSQ